MGGDLFEWAHAARVPAESDVSASGMGVGKDKCALRLVSVADVDTSEYEDESQLL